MSLITKIQTVLDVCKRLDARHNGITILRNVGSYPKTALHPRRLECFGSTAVRAPNLAHRMYHTNEYLEVLFCSYCLEYFIV